MCIFKANITKDKPMHVSNVYGGDKETRKPKIEKQSQDSIIKDVRYLFWLKIENKGIKNWIIRDIKKLSEQE